MTSSPRWCVSTAAALLAAQFLISLAAYPVAAQTKSTRSQTKANAANPPVAAVQPKQLPPRIPYTAADQAAATIPGMPDARFWADSVSDFNAALPLQPGPWLALSSGGADGAFGAGLINGLTESR